VFWYVRNQLRENAELACDAWVVRTLPDGRRSYAEALLAVCEFDPQTVPPPLPAWGVHGGTRRALERRLTMILRERLPVRVSRGAWIAVTLLAAIAVPNWYLVAEAQPAAENLTETDAIVPAEIPSLPPPFDAPAVETAPSDVSADSAATADAAPPVASSFAAEPAATVRDVPALEPSQSAIPMVSSLRRFPSQQPQPHVVESDSFTLTRTTYRVQPQVAANLKAFLEQNLSWPHLIGIEAKEYSVERENAVASRETLLIVTASPPAQEMIGNLIGLMLESKPRRTDLTDTALPSLNPETDSIEPLSR
jgi:hypothetical protein